MTNPEIFYKSEKHTFWNKFHKTGFQDTFQNSISKPCFKSDKKEFRKKSMKVYLQKFKDEKEPQSHFTKVYLRKKEYFYQNIFVLLPWVRIFSLFRFK